MTNGIVTSETSKPSVEFVERDLDDEELEEKKLQLMNAEIYKDKQELSIKEMEAQLDANIPMKFLEDDIAKLESDIKAGVTKDKDGSEIEATEADLEYMKIRLKFLKESKKKDLPLRELRFSILSAKVAMNRVDSPSAQIKKLQAEIRKRRETTLASRMNKAPIGVN